MSRSALARQQPCKTLPGHLVCFLMCPIGADLSAENLSIFVGPGSLPATGRDKHANIEVLLVLDDGDATVVASQLADALRDGRALRGETEGQSEERVMGDILYRTKFGVAGPDCDLIAEGGLRWFSGRHGIAVLGFLETE
ncbi:hypothetical protein MPH_04563 [Macrophomina phaseolina MS6]|uniref:Uncharacterized protein n=1 Tax=Macrophomina phaseolina (strain MS6) TaxID=1126212 RepID=K2S700_MACPH|nr:hypothetical protein MPH_04563 [Macrophomina phaseolina MS6]